jgi:signal peptide peptidase SppA
MRGSLILALLYSQPWAMAPDYLSKCAAVLERWAAGVEAAPEVSAEIEAAQAARAARSGAAANVGGGIAVLPLYGIMSQRAPMVTSLSGGGGGTSTEAFSAALRAALADDAVSGIIIDINSPGGSVFGTEELAAELLKARSQKPVYGYVNSVCASAAYWVGAQCTQLFSTVGGDIGSIGVFVAHSDESQALAAKGVKTTFVSAGKFKTEGNPAAPLTEEALAHLQSKVDNYYSMFTRAVAKGRGVPIETVRSGYGEGRTISAQDALTAGMIDGVCTFDEVVTRMARAIKSNATGMRAENDTAGIAAETDQAPLAQSLVEPAAQAGAEDEQGNHAARTAARRRAVEIAGI